MEKDGVDKQDLELLNRVKALRERNIRVHQEIPVTQEPRRNIWPIVLFVAGVIIAAALISLSISSDEKSPEIDSEKSDAVKKENTYKEPPASLFKKVAEKSPEKSLMEQPTFNGEETVTKERVAPKDDDPVTGREEQKAVSISPGTEPSIDEQADGLEEVRDEEIFMSESAVAEGILNFNPEGIRSTFTVGEDPSVLVWTEIKTKNFPTEIRHVYFVNGRQYTQVPLKISYSRMRTWSRVTLGNETHVGSWSVFVETKEGELLGEVNFTVR